MQTSSRAKSVTRPKICRYGGSVKHSIIKKNLNMGIWIQHQKGISCVTWLEINTTAPGHVICGINPCECLLGTRVFIWVEMSPKHWECHLTCYLLDWLFGFSVRKTPYTKRYLATTMKLTSIKQQPWLDAWLVYICYCLNVLPYILLHSIWILPLAVDVIFINCIKGIQYISWLSLCASRIK